MDCIYEGERKLYINPWECIDCGACQQACPVGAIGSDFRMDAHQRVWSEDNAKFFTQILKGRSTPLGEPSGAMSLGRIGADTDLAELTPAAPVPEI